jgi:FkbM family methyltransferase
MISHLGAMVQACRGEQVTLGALRLRVPGPLVIRLSVVAGNIRIQRLMDAAVGVGDCVVDVGANIGYNSAYAAMKVGPTGKVFALEPAQDNLAVLYANLTGNGLGNVTVLPYAAGSAQGVREFYLRGDVSAVNSFYPESFYAAVTQTVQVPVAPLDELIEQAPDLVKIDVEGAELEVLAGMQRMLSAPQIQLIVEWHPFLQQEAGYRMDELPEMLMDLGFSLRTVSYLRIISLGADDIAAWLPRLIQARRPLDLLATRL